MSVDECETESRRARLVAFLRKLPPHVLAQLANAKIEGNTHRSRPDWLWHSLVTSFSTMGNSRGYAALMGDPENLKNLSYDVLARLNANDRRDALEAGLRRAKVRMPKKKADWLSRNFTIIESMGGVSRANTIAFLQPGRSAKIAFLQQFHGIGEKYSRNIWMDIYDPDFRDSIAIDQRISNVSNELGISFSRYEDHEQYYQSLAKEVGLQPWELDRVLYGFLSDVLQAISPSNRRDGGRGQFPELLRRAREQARKAGLKKSDITAAIRKVRKRS